MRTAGGFLVLLASIVVGGCGGQSPAERKVEASYEALCIRRTNLIELSERLARGLPQVQSRDRSALQDLAAKLADDAERFEAIAFVRADDPDLGAHSRKMARAVARADETLDGGQPLALIVRLEQALELATDPITDPCSAIGHPVPPERLRATASYFGCFDLVRILRLAEQVVRASIRLVGATAQLTAIGRGFKVESALFADGGDRRLAAAFGRAADAAQDWKEEMEEAGSVDVGIDAIDPITRATSEFRQVCE